MLKKIMFSLLFSFAAASTGFAKIERTLSIIKPDAVKGLHIGGITEIFSKSGLKIVAMKMERLSGDKAARFYAVHKGKPFYESLTKYMTSGPVVEMVLEGENAIQKNRELMGATDPKKAKKGTIRALYGTHIGSNAVHGSDSAETAREEIGFFFASSDIVSY